MPSSILPGTLDLLILKAVSLGRQHGYSILLRIEQISGSSLQIEQGALYPALYRLEMKGRLSAEWGQSENNHRAKFYTLTSAGRKHLKDEVANWNQIVESMAVVLGARSVAR